MKPDKIDKAILNIIQTGFPITSSPYKDIADQVGFIDEDEAFERVKRLRNEGIIRRIGASFDSHGLGWVSTLCAAKVSEDKIKRFVEVVNSFPHVTHNYKREHEYNIWFTIIAPSKEKIADIIKQIEDDSGVSPVRDMPMKRKFKINLNFKFKDKDQES